MKFSVLASGSRGNACYVETAEARILVDAGLSCRELIRRLEIVQVAPSSVNALIITHEHLDHLRGAGPFARRFDIPVYINGPTLKRSIRTLGNLSKPVNIATGQAVTINDLLIETFTKCHDAVDPMGVVMSADGCRLGLITDLGRSTKLIEDRLKGCNGLIIEFNHDEKMLDEGPYPLELKRRIRGPDGHLSNLQARRLLKAVSHANLSRVVLAHISAENNLPEKAYKEAQDALSGYGLQDADIVVGEQDRAISMLDLA
ncbi:MBL fold metallo-hydrolase [Thermodesulfobacteriota bacterium]